MNSFIQAIYSCFDNNIISLENLDSVRINDQNIKYVLQSKTIIEIENLDIYNEKLINIEPDNLYRIFNNHNQKQMNHNIIHWCLANFFIS
jgi:hypothetical protein